MLIENRNVHYDLIISVLPRVLELDRTVREGSASEEIEEVGVKRKVEGGLVEMLEIVGVGMIFKLVVAIRPVSLLDTLGTGVDVCRFNLIVGASYESCSTLFGLVSLVFNQRQERGRLTMKRPRELNVPGKTNNARVVKRRREPAPTQALRVQDLRRGATTGSAADL